MSLGVAFLTQNIAYLCNIYRWKLLMLHLKGSHDPEELHNKEKRYNKLFWFWTSLFVIHAIIFGYLDSIKWKHTYLVFYVVQCLSIGLWFLKEYVKSYLRLKTYHETLISANHGLFSEKEIKDIRSRTR